MSKHKHFHSIKGNAQMLRHGCREGIGVFYRPQYQTTFGTVNLTGTESEPSANKEKAAPVLEHRSGKVETGWQAQLSASSLHEDGEDCKS